MCRKGTCSLSHSVCIDLWAFTFISVKLFLKQSFLETCLFRVLQEKLCAKQIQLGMVELQH